MTAKNLRAWLLGLAAWLAFGPLAPGAVVLECNFDSASGTTNASPIQGVVGGSAELKSSSPGTSVVANAAPLGFGGYLDAYLPVAAGSNAQGARLLPASPANSFAALFSTNPASGQRQLEGGFDFLFRSDSNIDTGEELRFLDHDNRSNSGLRMVLAGHGVGSSGDMILEVIGPANAFGAGVANASRTADAGFQILANRVYHLGVTFTTDDTTGLTTAKLFGVEGFNRINTSALTLADGFLGSFTFNMDESIVTAGFTSDPFYVGILRGSGVDKRQAFDAFRLYNSVPEFFAGVPEPSTFALTAIGLLLGGLAVWRRKGA